MCESLPSAPRDQQSFQPHTTTSSRRRRRGLFCSSYLPPHEISSFSIIFFFAQESQICKHRCRSPPLTDSATDTPPACTRDNLNLQFEMANLSIKDIAALSTAELPDGSAHLNDHIVSRFNNHDISTALITADQNCATFSFPQSSSQPTAAMSEQMFKHVSSRSFSPSPKGSILMPL